MSLLIKVAMSTGGFTGPTPGTCSVNKRKKKKQAKKNYIYIAAFTRIISSLPFLYARTNIHPFISILNARPECGTYIINEVQLLLTSSW